jgi:hypothetical protein
MNTRKLVPHGAQPAVRSAFDHVGRLTAAWRMDPGFVVIGGQRCGTTTIFKVLSAHPQLRRPPIDKGTDYYTLNYWRGPAWYRSRFPLRRPVQPSARRFGVPVAFEACTYYMFHPFAVERLAADFPDIKLVAMLRDPVERAYSAYKHEFARGFDTEPNFMRALELEDERVGGEEQLLRDSSYESFAHRHHAYRRRGEFADQLRRVYQHFPRSRVHVMQSEAFFANPAHEFQTLVEFLGVGAWQPPAFRQHNARPGSAMPRDARAFLIDHYREPDRDLADLLGRELLWAHP